LDTGHRRGLATAGDHRRAPLTLTTVERSGTDRPPGGPTGQLFSVAGLFLDLERLLAVISVIIRSIFAYIMPVRLVSSSLRFGSPCKLATFLPSPSHHSFPPYLPLLLTFHSILAFFSLPQIHPEDGGRSSEAIRTYSAISVDLGSVRLSNVFEC